MNALVYSSSLAAAFLGGVLALFAPCCVVSLLPTFVGAGLERGRVRLPVTAALFAAGVAAVLLPIVLGVGALGQVLLGHHRAVFFAVGSFLMILGISVLAGRHWAVPMPMLGIRATGSGSGGVFLLGVASGISSACCAPVLAGVVAMSALAASVTGAAGLASRTCSGWCFHCCWPPCSGIGGDWATGSQSSRPCHTSDSAGGRSHWQIWWPAACLPPSAWLRSGWQ